jgi:hypothetical protein
MNKRNEEAKRRIAQRAVLFAAVRRADPKNQVRSAMLTHGVSMSDLSDITGVEKRYSIWKILWSIVTLKFNNLSEAFKDMSEQSRNYKQSKNNSNNENVL